MILGSFESHGFSRVIPVQLPGVDMDMEGNIDLCKGIVSVIAADTLHSLRFSGVNACVGFTFSQVLKCGTVCAILWLPLTWRDTLPLKQSIRPQVLSQSPLVVCF
jgi:hypothetical protein